MLFINYLVGILDYISRNLTQTIMQIIVLLFCVYFIILGNRKYPDQIRNDKSALFRIVGTYAFFGSLWIFLSDSILLLITHNPAFISSISMFKGIVFIISTSVLLYLLFKNYLKKYQISQKALAESEQRFRVLVEQAPEAIFVYSVDDNKVIDVNSQAEKLFGLNREKLLELNFHKVYANTAFNHETSAKQITERLNKVLAGENYSGERYIRNSQGQDIPCEIYIVKLPSINQRLVRVSYIDISARKKAEIRSKELIDLKNNFIRIVSHQLRTPLTIINWTLDTLLSGDNGKLNQNQEKTIRIASKSNKDIIYRLNDLLTVMDIEENHISLNTEKVQLETLVKSVVNVFKPSFKIKKIQLIISCPETDLSPVEIDPTRIRDVITKLIDNALTYTPDSGKVEIKIFTLESYIRFEIIDNGIGIPETEQSHIFHYFHRASNAYTMKEDSSGISLGISKYFIEAHNGQIGFSSKEGKGSTFWFTLPVLPKSVL